MSIFVSLCLPVALSFSLSVALCLSVFLSVSQCLPLSLSVPKCVSLSLSASQCLYVSQCLFLCLSISLCLSVSLSVMYTLHPLPNYPRLRTIKEKAITVMGWGATLPIYPDLGPNDLEPAECQASSPVYLRDDWFGHSLCLSRITLFNVFGVKCSHVKWGAFNVKCTSKYRMHQTPVSGLGPQVSMSWAGFYLYL